MKALLLIYNVFLMILYCIPLLFGLLIYSKNKKSIYLYLSLLFGVYALDEIVIYITEFIPSFSDFYKRIMYTAPTWKTIIYFISFLCILKIMELLLCHSLPVSLYVAFVGVILFLLFVPGMNDGSLQLLLYYTASSVFSIAIGLYGLYHCRKIPASARTEAQRYLHFMLILLVLLYTAVILEDYFTLFNPGSILYRNTRSISEDIFRIILTVLYSVCLIKKLTSLIMGNGPQNETLTVSETKSLTTADLTEEKDEKKEEYSKFYLFCREYQLTPREQDILLLLLDNKNNTEISEQLIISLGTTKTHIHNIYVKLDVKKRRQMFEVYENFEV